MMGRGCGGSSLETWTLGKGLGFLEEQVGDGPLLILVLSLVSSNVKWGAVPTLQGWEEYVQ